jgi:hypothetical protein
LSDLAATNGRGNGVTGVGGGLTTGLVEIVVVITCLTPLPSNSASFLVKTKMKMCAANDQINARRKLTPIFIL